MTELLSREKPTEMSASEDRVYFAALPDANAKAEIAKLGSRVRSSYRLREEPFDLDRLHVSLCFVGMHKDLTGALMDKARKAAAAVRMRPFTVAFNCMTRFSTGLGKRPLVLLGDDGVGGLTALQRSLGIAMQEAGFGRRTSLGYTLHVRLMYGTLPIDEQTITPIRWTVRDFVLVHSLHGKHRHIHLDRWPLRG
jgi:2'-5' RNA ligase